MVDEFCRAAEFVPTPGGTPLHLVATFQRGVLVYHPERAGSYTSISALVSMFRLNKKV